MHYDPDRTYWYAVAAVVSGFAWVLYYGLGAKGRFIMMDGSPLVLIREQTQYGSYHAYAYGEHGAIMWPLTILPMALTAWWAYRAQADDWQCLYGR